MKESNGMGKACLHHLVGFSLPNSLTAFYSFVSVLIENGCMATLLSLQGFAIMLAFKYIMTHSKTSAEQIILSWFGI